MWMLRVACPSITAWHWCGWAGSLSTWGPEPHLGPCAAPGGGRFGTWGFHRLCMSAQKILCGSSGQLLTSVQRSLRLVPLGASHPSGVAPAELVPHRWSGELLVPGKSHSVPYSWVVVWQSGCWSVSGNLHPLERLVLPGVELDGWKTELKMASLGSVQGLDRRGSCSPLWSLQERAGRGRVCLPCRMVCVLAGCVCPPAPRAAAKHLAPGLGWDWWGVNVTVPGGIAVGKSFLHQNPITLWVVSTVWAPWWPP